MKNNSASGGFLQPIPQPPTLDTSPPGLTLIQFFQTLLVGLSAFPGTLVRPSWQAEPPKQPDICVNWLAFGINNVNPDFNAYVGLDADNNATMQRNELVQLSVSIYGPDSYDNLGLIRDGLQLTENLASLRQANIGFAYDSQARHLPDLINARWVDRWQMDLFFRRQIQRSYPILTFLSASGIIYTQTAADADYQLSWTATEG